MLFAWSCQSHFMVLSSACQDVINAKLLNSKWLDHMSEFLSENLHFVISNMFQLNFDLHYSQKENTCVAHSNPFVVNDFFYQVKKSHPCQPDCFQPTCNLLVWLSYKMTENSEVRKDWYPFFFLQGSLPSSRILHCQIGTMLHAFRHQWRTSSMPT